MPQDTSNIFDWQPPARVLTPGAEPVERPVRPTRQAGTWHDIATAPAAQVLPLVHGAISAGQGFSVVPTPMQRRFTPDEFSRHAPIFATWTGGTTGSPRRVLRSHASWIASFDINREKFAIAPGACVAIFGTLSHSLALYAAMEALHLGADLLDLSGTRPDRQCAHLLASGATVLYITPVQLGQLVDGAAGRKLDGIRHILVGGAALDLTVAARAQALMPQAALHVFYGASETSFVTLTGPDTPPGSVGKPYPGVEITLRDTNGATVPDGGAGAVHVRSPYLFLGYAPCATDGVTLNEIARRDTAGNLWLMGRRDRMFTVGDQNLYPEAIEAHLMRQPGVELAGVIDLPDPRRGAVALGFVAGSVSQGDLEMLLLACRRQFGAMIAPRRIIQLRDWPLLPSGKTDYAQLRHLAQDLAQ